MYVLNLLSCVCKLCSERKLPINLVCTEVKLQFPSLSEDFQNKQLYFLTVANRVKVLYKVTIRMYFYLIV